MRDEDKTKEQLLTELRDLRCRVAAFERDGAALGPVGGPHRLEDADRFRLLCEEAPLPYQSLDENGNFIYVNRAWLETLGYTEAEVIGKNFCDFLPPDWVEHFRKNFPRFKAEGEVLGVEFRMVKKEGSTILVSFNGRISRDHHGDFQQTHCIFQDITERKHVEDALVESRAKLESALASMTDAVIIWDARGRVVEFNEAFATFYRFKDKSECLKTFSDYPDLLDVFMADGSPVPLDMWAVPRALRGERATNCEFSLRRKDTGETWVGSYSFGPIRDKTGAIIGAVVVGRDITEKKQAEEELQKLYRQIHLILDAADEGIVGLDLKGKVTFANPYALKEFGYSIEELLGSDFHEVVHCSKPDAAPYPFDECPMCHTLAYGIASRIREEELCSKSGERFPCACSINPIIDDGKVAGAVLTFRNITDRKRAEDLRTSLQAQLASALEMARLGPWEYDVINDIFTFNDHFYSIFRTSVEQVGGYTMSSAEYASRFVHPEDRGVIAEEIRKAIDTMEPRFSRKIEHRILYADGGVGYTSVQISIVKDSRGRTIKTYGVNQDITERKQVEQDLRESEARFKALHNASFGGIGIHDQGIILECNQGLADITGYSIEELIGMDGLLLLDGKSRNIAMQNILSGYEKPYEVTGLHKDGTEYPVRIEARNIPYKGRLVRATEFRDLTEFKRGEEEREKLQAQLNQAQKLESVGRLAGGVAHDFNNMLGVILGHAEMALEKVDQSHSLFANLTEIRKAALRSADLTRQLLAFARRQTISPRVLDLNETVEGMLKMLRRLIGEDVDLAWFPAKSLWPVKVDPGQIDQILANLCVNARDAISVAGKITIETGTTFFNEAYCNRHPSFVPGEFVILAVSDNGCGMDEETLAKIFEPFYTTKGVGKGTGLGLATVYGIVRQNNGFINVYSEPGQGTTFKIYIPRAEEQKAQESPAVSKKDLRGRETVLLVEDEKPMLDLGRTILQTHGYEVLAANSPAEALAMARSYNAQIHLLVTDVVMPEMNGKDLRDKLAEIKPGAKSIFMSGYTANVIAHHGILDEGIDFLQKPFSVQTLLEKVRDVLDG